MYSDQADVMDAAIWFGVNDVVSGDTGYPIARSVLAHIGPLAISTDVVNAT